MGILSGGFDNNKYKLGETSVITFILNDPPYGTEKSYNALRLAMSLVKAGNAVSVFMFADAVFCGIKGQKTPDGYYNIERMLSYIIRKGNDVHACGTCIDARGLKEESLAEGIKKSDLATVTTWVEESDKCLVF